MDLAHLPTPKSPPDEFYISALALLLGSEQPFRNQSLTEFVDTEAFASAIVTTSNMFINMAYIYGFGAKTTPAEAADIVRHELSHVDDSGRLRVITVAVMAIALMLVIMRLATRWKALARFMIDDALIVLGLVFNYALSILVLISPEDVRQVWDISFDNVEAGLDRCVLLLTFSLIGHLFTQLSLLEMYRNLFPSKPLFHKIALTVSAICSVGTLALLVVNRIYSHPHALDFKSINEGIRTGNACSVFFIATDFIILALPVGMVSRLQMPLRTKLGVIFMFTLGACACVFSVLRITAFNKQAHNPNFSGNAFNLGMYTIFEQYLGLICACLPALRAVFRNQVARVSSVLSGSSKNSSVSDDSSREEKAEPPMKLITTAYATIAVPNKKFTGSNDSSTNDLPKTAITTKTQILPKLVVPPVSPSACGHLPRNKTMESKKSGVSLRTLKTYTSKVSTILSWTSREVPLVLDDPEQGVPFCFDCGQHIRGESLGSPESIEIEELPKARVDKARRLLDLRVPMSGVAGGGRGRRGRRH